MLLVSAIEHNHFNFATKRTDHKVTGFVDCNAILPWQKLKAYKAINEPNEGINIEVDFLSYCLS